MLCNCYWIVLCTAHVTAFCLGGRFFGHGVEFNCILLYWCRWNADVKNALYNADQCSAGKLKLRSHRPILSIDSVGSCDRNFRNAIFSPPHMLLYSVKLCSCYRLHFVRICSYMRERERERESLFHHNNTKQYKNNIKHNIAQYGNNDMCSYV